MNHWPKLSHTLALRRNLQNALTPASKIGSLSTRGQFETVAEFSARIRESRDRHTKESNGLREAHALTTDHDVRDKIESLKAQEAELWKLCRPDLYV